MEIIAFLAAILALSGASQAADNANSLRLADAGSSRVTVVAPAEAGKFTKLAVDDLVRCLDDSLGAEVPVVETISAVRTPLSILIGESFGADFGVPMQDMHRDSCLLSSRGNSLLITGPGDSGITNGIYTFLMDYVGARWFAPGQLYEVVPTRPDLELPQVYRLSTPDFSYRIFSGAVGAEGGAWMRRNRLDTDRTGLPYFGFGHNLAAILPVEKYGEDHPEYFAMIDGTRRVQSKGVDAGAQPCFTNPEVIRIAAEAASEFFRKNPQATTFSLCINDNALFCQCPDCSALDEPRRKSNGGWDTYSDSYFHFVRQVADRVARTDPGKYLGCYAYWGVEPLPRDGKPLPENVVIALTQDTSQHFDPDYRAADRKLWLDWSSIASHLGKYDYYGLGWLTPRVFPTLAASDLQFIARNSADGLYCEIYPNWSITAPQLYMATRMLWDSSLSGQELLDEYYRTLFGPAAGEMRRFYSLLEKHWTQPRKGQWFQGLDNVRPELAMIDEQLIEEAWQCLARAKPLAIGSDVERIADVEDHFKFTYSIVKGYAAAQRLAGWKITDQPDLAMLIGESLNALEIVRLAESAHKDVWLADPLYRHAYYDDVPRFHRKFQVWRDEVRAGVQVALLKVSDYCHSRLPAEQSETVWQDLRDRLLADETAKQFRILDSLEPRINCRRVSLPMVIDGRLTDWRGVPTNEFSTIRSFAETAPPEDNLDALFRIAWDDSFFYFACEVTEDELVQTLDGGAIWREDSVQIGLDPRLDALTGAGYGDDDSEIGFALSASGPIAWRWQAPKGRERGPVSSAATAVRRVGRRTTYEAAIPWSELAFARVGDGAKFGLSVVVNDYSREHGRVWLEWGGGIARSKDPRQFIPVKLKD